MELTLEAIRGLEVLAGSACVCVLMAEAGAWRSLYKQYKQINKRRLAMLGLIVPCALAQGNEVPSRTAYEPGVRHELQLFIPSTECLRYEGMADWACHTQGMEQSLTAMGGGTSPKE